MSSSDFAKKLYEQAQNCYSQGMNKMSLNICMDLMEMDDIEDDIRKKTEYLHIMISIGALTENEEYCDLVCNKIIKFLSKTENYTEFLNCKNEFEEAIYKRNVEYVTRIIDDILLPHSCSIYSDDVELAWNDIKQLNNAHFQIQNVALRLRTATDAMISTIAELDGISEELIKEEDSKFPDNFSTAKDIIDNLMYNAALKLFKHTVDEFEKLNYSSVEVIRRLSLKTLTRKNIANLLAGYNMPRLNPSPKDIDKFIKHLKLSGEIKSWGLNCVLHFQGKHRSLYTDNDRIREMSELKKIYEQIKEYEPSYIPPELPDDEGINTTQSSTSGCYIATAVYGSYDCPEVWTLRRYRDYNLAKTWYGRAFIRTYYAISPTLVKWFGHTDWFKTIWHSKLDKMVSKLQAKGVEDTPYEDRKW